MINSLSPRATSQSTTAVRKGYLTVSGTLQHADKSPFASQKIALYAPEWFELRNRYLVSTVTDKNGKFSFTYKDTSSLFDTSQELLIKVLTDTMPSESVRERVVESIKSKILFEGKKSSYDLGVITGHLYEYDPTLPMLAKPTSDVPDPQQWSEDFIIRLIKDAWKPVLKQAGITVLENKLTTGLVQYLFSNGAEQLKLTCENTIDMILNGIYPCYFKRGENENELLNTISWGQYAKILQITAQCPIFRMFPSLSLEMATPLPSKASPINS